LFLYKNVFVIFKYEKERQNNDCKTMDYLKKVLKFINSTTIMLFLTNKSTGFCVLVSKEPGVTPPFIDTTINVVK